MYRFWLVGGEQVKVEQSGVLGRRGVSEGVVEGNAVVFYEDTGGVKVIVVKRDPAFVLFEIVVFKRDFALNLPDLLDVYA